MDSPRYSQGYIQHRQRGPFPGHIDPWAEAGRYFHQIHSGMINHLQDQLQDDLNALGYQAGKEASLQIYANRKPDLYIQSMQRPQRPAPEWDYATAAAAIQVEPGTTVMDELPDLDALYITDMDSGNLVTVIEIISPRNKTHLNEMALYKSQRHELFLSQGVNVVEIDATRSITRLLVTSLVEENPYHIAIYLPGTLPRVLVSDFETPLKPFALPLRGEVVRVETQSAYDRAYQRGAVAGLIEGDNQYIADSLPFPTTLTDEQRTNALTAVDHWRTELERLQQET